MKIDKEKVLTDLYFILKESKDLKDFISDKTYDEIKIKVKKPFLVYWDKVFKRKTMKISYELLYEILTIIIIDTRSKLRELEDIEE